MALFGRAQITQITQIIWKDGFGWSLTDHTDFTDYWVKGAGCATAGPAFVKILKR